MCLLANACTDTCDLLVAWQVTSTHRFHHASAFGPHAGSAVIFLRDAMKMTRPPPAVRKSKRKMTTYGEEGCVADRKGRQRPDGNFKVEQVRDSYTKKRAAGAFSRHRKRGYEVTAKLRWGLEKRGATDQSVALPATHQPRQVVACRRNIYV